MAGTITTGNHPAALWPGVRKFWGAEYKDYSPEYSQIFETVKSRKKYEEDVEITGFGLAPIKNEGAAVEYDSHQQGPTKRYTHVAYGLGYIVTREEMDDNLYMEVSRARVRGLARSMKQTKEIVGANILNRGFDSNFTGADGKELFATDHPSLAGDWSNELATPADLSEAAMEDLLIQIANTRDRRGLRIALMGKCLVVPPNLMFEAERIVKSTLRVATADNDANAMRSMGMLPGGVKVNHYLTDVDAWFIQTDCPNGLMHFERVGSEFTKDNDFDTQNAKAKSYERYSFGWTDPRGIFGSPGA